MHYAAMPTSEGSVVQKRHRNQSVATMVMSQCTLEKCSASFGIFSITSSCSFGVQRPLALMMEVSLQLTAFACGATG